MSSLVEPRICTRGPDAAVATRHERSVEIHPAGWMATLLRTGWNFFFGGDSLDSEA